MIKYMSKKKINLLAILTISLTLTACGVKPDPGPCSAVSTEPETSTEVSAEPETDKKDETSVEDIKPSEIVSEKNTGDKYVYCAAYKSLLVTDSKGAVKDSILLGEAASTDGADNEWKEFPYSVEAFCKDKVLYLDFLYDDETYEGNYVLYLRNINSNDTSVIFQGPKFSYADCYDGKIYVVFYDYETSGYGCRVFDEETGEELTLEHDYYKNIPEGYYMEGFNYKYDYNLKPSIERALDEYGYMILSGNDEYVSYDGANITTLDIPDISGIACYNDKYIFYETINEKRTSYPKLWVYDIKGKSSKLICECLDTFLDLEGNYAYWSEFRDSNGIDEYLVSTMNLESGEMNRLAESGKVPGMDGFVPVTTGFDAVSTGGKPDANKVYFLDKDENGIGWYTLNGTAKESLNIHVKSFDVFEYGTVDSVADIEYCPFCGLPILKVSNEILIFDESISEYTDKMNNTLYMDAIGTLNLYKDDPAMLSEDDSLCESHATYMGMETYEQNISGVSEIGSHYLTIDLSGYWYTGGVHGMPSESHYLFDLNNGESLKFTDLYKGTEEELKTIVSELVREDVSNPESANYELYYAIDDPEATVHDAYEYTTLEAAEVRFGKDNLYYQFAPYLLGPYASGFIEIKIPYEALGININE